MTSNTTPGIKELSPKDQSTLESLLEVATSVPKIVSCESSPDDLIDDDADSISDISECNMDWSSFNWIVSDHSLQNMHIKYVPEHVHRKEQKAVYLAEINKDYEASIKLLDDILTQYPGYAPAYNNRAQVKRLVAKELENKDTSISIYVDIIKDLEKCIELSSTTARRDMDETSPFQRLLLSNAHTQLGLTFLNIRDQFGELTSLNGKLVNLEVRAQRHLRFAGAYGNKAAGKLAVLSNKYAQMCGDIVRQALIQEFCHQNE